MCLLLLLQDQYVFIHTALDELLTCGETEITAGDIRFAIRKLDKKQENSSVNGFEKQFNVRSKNTLF